jgi:restriction system protein
MAWLKMHDNSLFAILLNKSWWVSGLVAAGVFGVARIFLPWDFAAFVSGPFAAISLYVMYRQIRTPGAARIAKTNEKLRAMSWDEFAAAIEAAYRREGYAVSRIAGGQADFELVRELRHTLVVAKRWKAGRTGIEPLRELDAVREKREAHAGFYVVTGEVSAQARVFAAERKITIVEGAQLAELMRI